MPLDGTELTFLEDQRLLKLAAVERLIATPDQWCKGELHSNDGRHCLIGAMEIADARRLLEPVILKAVKEVGRRRCWRIEFFNDHPRTTHSDVLRVLRRAREKIIASMMEGDHPPSVRQRLLARLRALCIDGPAAALTTVSGLVRSDQAADEVQITSESDRIKALLSECDERKTTTTRCEVPQ